MHVTSAIQKLASAFGEKDTESYREIAEQHFELQRDCREIAEKDF